jgi:copper chaperone CopZ
MLIVLVASIPLYVCATGSVPIAAVLLMKGLSPGAAIVFLMAGPATNAATMTVIGKVMGSRTLYIYLGSIIAGALLFGILVNEWLPREWFMVHSLHVGGHTHLLPEWLNVVSGIVLFALIVNGYVQKYRSGTRISKTEPTQETFNMNSMEKQIITVHGMTCNHCVASVERSLSALEGITKIDIDLPNAKVLIEGDHIDLQQIKEKVEEIGYEYAGKSA